MLTRSGVCLPSNLQTFGFDSQLSPLILKSITTITTGRGHEGATWGGWLTPRPGRFTPGKRPGIHCADSVGLTVGLGG
jgi:hypothetical protein